MLPMKRLHSRLLAASSSDRKLPTREIMDEMDARCVLQAEQP